jgi:hypothetical protein
MATEQRRPYGLDPSQVPKRMGQPWKEGEITRLLRSIQQKKSVEEMANEHERTVSGIQCYIKKLAVEYHVNRNMPMEEIQRTTGLTRETIEDAIQKYGDKGGKKPREIETQSKQKEPTMAEVVLLLKDIQTKLAMLCGNSHTPLP